MKGSGGGVGTAMIHDSLMSLLDRCYAGALARVHYLPRLKMEICFVHSTLPTWYHAPCSLCSTSIHEFSTSPVNYCLDHLVTSSRGQKTPAPCEAVLTAPSGLRCDVRTSALSQQVAFLLVAALSMSKASNEGMQLDEKHSLDFKISSSFESCLLLGL